MKPFIRIAILPIVRKTTAGEHDGLGKVSVGSLICPAGSSAFFSSTQVDWRRPGMRVRRFAGEKNWHSPSQTMVASEAWSVSGWKVSGCGNGIRWVAMREMRPCWAGERFDWPNLLL